MAPDARMDLPLVYAILGYFEKRTSESIWVTVARDASRNRSKR